MIVASSLPQSLSFCIKNIIIAGKYFYVLIVERVLWLRQGSKPINNRHIHQRTYVTCAIKYLPTIQYLVIILELFTKRRKLSARSVLRRMTLHLKIQFNDYLEIKLSLYSGADIFRIGSVFCGPPPFVHDIKMCSYFFIYQQGC